MYLGCQRTKSRHGKCIKETALATAGMAMAGMLLAANCSGTKHDPPQTAKPNIVFIMIDDLGYGDIGCYGSEVNRTPHIDRLAAEGRLFTDFHANGPMCSPTRAALMTGMYQHRFGINFESAISGKQDYDDGLPLEAVTIAEALKEDGYATGMYGKWHLGYHPPFLPLNQGFDEFVGLGSGDGDHHSHIDRSGRKDWWHHNRLQMEEGYSTDLITKHSIAFIKAHKHEPFFLYVSHLAIHFPWQGPADPPHRVEGTDYTDDKWGIIPDRLDVSPHVTAMIESVDDGVGMIMATLKDLNLAENTVVIFTSDNGGYIHYADSHFNISSNGPLRGQKTEVYEGGHRVPFIACWPGTIEAGSRSDETIMTMDMFPTFLDLADAGTPKGVQPDGISIMPHLLTNEPLAKRAVCWKIGDERAIRTGDWKLCLIGENEPELFDLSGDIGETENLAADRPEVVRKLTAEYTEWENEVTANYRR
jgi:arylsulfatase A-like enzyme